MVNRRVRAMRGSARLSETRMSGEHDESWLRFPIRNSEEYVIIWEDLIPNLREWSKSAFNTHCLSISQSINRCHCCSLEWVLQEYCNASVLNGWEIKYVLMPQTLFQIQTNAGNYLQILFGHVRPTVWVSPWHNFSSPEWKTTRELFIALPNSPSPQSVTHRLHSETVCHWSVCCPDRRDRQTDCERCARQTRHAEAQIGGQYIQHIPYCTALKHR